MPGEGIVSYLRPDTRTSKHPFKSIDDIPFAKVQQIPTGVFKGLVELPHAKNFGFWSSSTFRFMTCAMHGCTSYVHSEDFPRYSGSSCYDSGCSMDHAVPLPVS